MGQIGVENGIYLVHTIVGALALEFKTALKTAHAKAFEENCAEGTPRHHLLAKLHHPLSK